ncbi:peptidoglycan editing factor PgeF [Halobacillus litoralis]|uniref:peptidoglycan editing factor PgeF n=1 Tax=Halobacillus litoralis TaxID=45668 RepID=UPI001CFCC0A8|nr:peptidoglycan editing factor PgeF [Halobacillus litoralis]WLR47027.1 peptidoglycan editing factor PgeF [Halobacillus litoralis]
MEPFQSHSIRQMTCFHSHQNVTAGLTTRQGGHSEAPFDSLNMGLHVSDKKENVLKNRRALAEEIGIPLSRWVIGEQVHGTEVAAVDKGNAGAGATSLQTAVSKVDGLITNEKNLVLGAFFADCVPLYFADSESGWVGIAHAGWKGTVNGMAGEMLRALQDQRCKLENIQVVIGPSIGKKHYEVDDHVISFIPESYKKECVISKGRGKYQLDLKILHRRMMIEEGLGKNNIQMTDFCTYEEEKTFYSHRRDQGSTGRMLGYITLRT